VDRPLAALNTAFATDGIVIRATGKAAKPDQPDLPAPR
jgi:Fe-S cluster assembly protein SufD